MTRAECLEHIWSVTHDDYRGYAGEDVAEPLRGRRFVLCYGRRPGRREASSTNSRMPRSRRSCR